MNPNFSGTFIPTPGQNGEKFYPYACSLIGMLMNLTGDINVHHFDKRIGNLSNCFSIFVRNVILLEWNTQPTVTTGRNPRINQNVTST